MKFISGFRCTECGTLYPSDTPMNLCPKDDRPVKMEINTEALAEAYPDLQMGASVKLESVSPQPSVAP